MWLEPKETSGGQWTGWEEVKRKRWFVLQRHLSADKPIERLVFGFRSLLSSSPQQPYRIIISVRPFYAIALGANLKEILEHWKWVNRYLVKTGRLSGMEEKEAIAFLNYIFSLLATGKEDKAKLLLLPESRSTTPAVEEESEATLTTSSSASTTSTSVTTIQEDSPHPPSPTTVDSASSDLSSSTTSTTTSPSSSRAVATRILPTSSDKVATDNAGDDDDLCKLCFESPIDTVILDCGHALLCSRCADELRIDAGCPVCRNPIRCLQKMYKC